MTAAQRGWRPVERLRQIWTPRREVEEMMANLEPQTALDSQIRDYFTRIVRRHGSITVSLDEPNTGAVRWEVVSSPPGLPPHREVTIWWVP